MVMMSPQIATRKPAPQASLASRTWRSWPSGAPRREAERSLGHAHRKHTVAGLLVALDLAPDLVRCAYRARLVGMSSEPVMSMISASVAARRISRSDLTSLPMLLLTREGRLWNEFVARYHYLGYKTLVGTQMRYAVHDRNGWPLAMLGFTRLRHYGLLANRCRVRKLDLCRALLRQPVPEPRDLQHRPGQPVHQFRLHQAATRRRHPHLEGRPRPVHGQHLHRAAVALAQVRGSLPVRDRRRLHGPAPSEASRCCRSRSTLR